MQSSIAQKCLYWRQKSVPRKDVCREHVSRRYKFDYIVQIWKVSQGKQLRWIETIPWNVVAAWTKPSHSSSMNEGTVAFQQVPSLEQEWNCCRQFHTKVVVTEDYSISKKSYNWVLKGLCCLESIFAEHLQHDFVIPNFRIIQGCTIPANWFYTV
jgi:hypothetical protein